MKLKWMILILISTTILSWILIINYRDHLGIIIGFFATIFFIAVFFRNEKWLRSICILLNPVILISLFSFYSGMYSVIEKRPRLVYVSYGNGPDKFEQRDKKIRHSTIDPEFGCFDYLHAIPHNMGVRLVTSFTGRADKPFVLFYWDEFPYIK